MATASRSADLVVTLVTRGSPTCLTGGHLFHHRMAQAASSRGVEMRFLSTTGWRSPLRAAGGVVVVDSLTAWSVAPWLPLERRPVAAMVHQPPGSVGHHRLRATTQRWLDLACFRQCRLLLASSRALAAALVDEHGLSQERVLVVEPGCDLPAVTGPPADLRRGRRIAVLSVANWLPAKGIVDLVDAVGAMAPGHVTLHLVGHEDVDARYAAKVVAALAAPQLGDRVVRHGPLPSTAVARLARSADVFALPSYAESYGMAFAEALVAGLPVVGWAAGNVPNLVTDGRHGRLLAPGDVTGLTATLDRLAVDDVWRMELAAAPRRRGQELPTWDAAADRFFAALRELVTAPGGGASHRSWRRGSAPADGRPPGAPSSRSTGVRRPG